MAPGGNLDKGYQHIPSLQQGLRPRSHVSAQANHISMGAWPMETNFLKASRRKKIIYFKKQTAEVVLLQNSMTGGLRVIQVMYI